MRSKDILKKALRLEPAEKFLIVEGLLKSLDEPDRDLDDLWTEEAERRLEAYRAGKLSGIPMKTIFAPSK